MQRFDRRLRFAMLGGGPGSFVGDVHRRAARLVGVDLVAGSFSTNPERNRRLGRELHLSPERTYDHCQSLIDGERALPDRDRADFVAVVTPNHLHLPMCGDLLRAGFHVLCDKPAALDLQQALKLRHLVDQSQRLFGLSYNYPGYPMVKLARDLVAQGELGTVRKVLVRYQQGWMACPVEQQGVRQALWRTDPRRSGVGGTIADVGTHAFHLAEYVAGVRVTELCADLGRVVAGRALDDDDSVLLRFENGARGVLHASQVSIGQENGVDIQVFGDRASLEWRQEDPNYLHVRNGVGPRQTWSRGSAYVAARSPAAERASHIAPGHAEGFVEAFANVYRNFADTLRARLEQAEPHPLAADFAGIDDGVRGMAFVEAAVTNSAGADKWTVLTPLL